MIFMVPTGFLGFSFSGDSSNPKENKNSPMRDDSIKLDQSQQINGNLSSFPTSNQTRRVSMKAHRVEKTKPQVHASMMHKPRLYKRRGESTLSGNIQENFSGEVHETIQILDVQKTPRDIAGTNSISRSEGISDLMLSRTVSPSHMTKNTSGDQTRQDSGVGSAHIGFSSGTGGKPGAASSRSPCIGNGNVATKRARDTARSPASYLQRVSDARRHSVLSQEEDRKDYSEISILGPVDGNVRPINRSYLQNKKISMLAKRAATLKSVEVKPAPSQAQGNDQSRGRLHEVNNQRRGNNSDRGGRPNPQVYRVIPRPFIPFRSAHEKPNALANSYPQQVGSPQKSKTFESLTLGHENSGVPSSRVSGTPITSREAQAPGPPRPVIVRKRLAKRHRLGETHTLQPSLIHDIDQTVTANSFASADPIIPNTQSKKIPPVKENLL